MVDAIDPARLASLPADVRAAFEAQAKMLVELDQERSARMRLEAENAFLKQANSRLEYLVRELRRARFGPRSEKLDPDQQQLAFEDIEIAIAESRESVARRDTSPITNDNKRKIRPWYPY